MTKLLGTLILTVLLTTSASPQGKSTDLERESLKGPVHLVTEESSQITSVGELVEKEPARKRGSLTFDPQGRLIESAFYEGVLISKTKYSHEVERRTIAETFDPNGHLREKRALTYGARDELVQALTYDEKGALYLKEEYLYDKQGRLSAEVYYDPKIARGKTAFQTDDQGHPTEAAFILADGSKATAPIGPCYEAHKVVYVYDGQHRVIEETAFQLDGSVKRRSSYSYDEKDNIREEVRISRLTVLKYVHSYEYDQHGNWITHTTEMHAKREGMPLLQIPESESLTTTVTTRKITYF